MIYKGMVAGMYDVHCPGCNKYLFCHHSSYRLDYYYCSKCKKNICFIDFLEIKR